MSDENLKKLQEDLQMNFPPTTELELELEDGMLRVDVLWRPLEGDDFVAYTLKTHLSFISDPILQKTICRLIKRILLLNSDLILGWPPENKEM